MSKKIYKPRPVSGFPEFSPAVRRVEQQWLDIIRDKFESYGFCSLETSSVEELAVIEAKSEDGGDDADKEIYVLERLHKEEGDKEARLALHFDLTVPLARYAAQNFNELVFPFKRYQMQKVWRGERPQAGRFREFVQCDIDVINVDHVPLHFDAEMPAIIWETLTALPGMENQSFQIGISNRKILVGLLQALNVDNVTEVTRWIDKLDKLHIDMVKNELGNCGLDEGQIGIILKLVAIQASPADLSESLRSARDDVIARSTSDEAIQVFNDGIDELTFVMDQLTHLPKGAVQADLSIVRGLDYYTGTVYETRFTDDPGYGSICSGGRYDDLAGHYINKKLPGVGISIGFTRLFDRLRAQGMLETGRISPADVLVVLPSEEARALAATTAQILRARGIKTEQYHAPQKIGKQIAYAEKKGIPYVWFPDLNEVKTLKTGEQTTAKPEKWKTS